MTAKKPRVPRTYKAKGDIEPTEADKAYAAGFLDGEGCVFIAKADGRTGCRGFRYHMRVVFGQDDIRPLKYLYDRWGGALSAKRIRENGKRSHNWILHATGAAAFLQDVLPYLLLKADRARLAILYQNTVFQPGPKGHSQEYRDTLERIYAELRRLNQQRGEWL